MLHTSLQHCLLSYLGVAKVCKVVGHREMAYHYKVKKHNWSDVNGLNVTSAILTEEELSETTNYRVINLSGT